MAKAIENLTTEEQATFREEIGVTTESVLALLQGSEADPTRIGAEYLPEVASFDQMLPGESFDGVFPVGTVTRQGSSLRIHDNSTAGGVEVGASNYGNTIGGHVASLPYGTTVDSVASTVKNPTSSSRYYQELGRVTLDGAKLVAGNRISLAGWMRVFSDTNGTTATSHLVLIPADIWATADLGGLGSGALPALPYVRVFNAASRDIESRFWLALKIVSSGAIQTSSDPSSIQARGYDYTNSAAYSDNGIGGSLDNMLTLGTTTDFVIAARTGSAETRHFEFQITATSRPQ